MVRCHGRVSRGGAMSVQPSNVADQRTAVPRHQDDHYRECGDCPVRFAFDLRRVVSRRRRLSIVWTAPERLSDDESSGDRRCKADVYALGILLSSLDRWAMPEEVEWFTPTFPDALRVLITKCLHLFPHDRPSAMVVACQLRRQVARDAA
ncbi:hypothetical protein, variant 1 [Aphanomyces astaci]|uniref:Protein kinase domain-containing protein n=1 Tax=Aphanomyces astaci TaxID=112090 RepID=W4GWB9_APHAT|nr:hypothetical protein H257_04075 [Aphanomyces astaci]XP_009826753.1 hypothetical protein, variant 2 [Aphanomyces astaci]XP_009826754.1 hypothetical protein, variant 1 [Aphanomyces astaci]ETV83322.1 hypothetical protein H257_04075 [Aphanomyces astaci]ETV83323.1 hypothetical protein, variant 1 [Aphanomyces astaci]ETV83324.1 hypothetical protein, variant 2 [Aphanomyces astaci]|eukprot:XP_009826752.1 hypothetical protein H257_04075 [Aphanomyces astaci]